MTPPAFTPIRGVIFDFHSTLVDGGDPATWLRAAFEHLGQTEAPAPDAAARLITHLRDMWPHARTIDPDSERDLSPQRHREVFIQTVNLLPDIDPALTDALYDVMPDQWHPYDDTLPVLNELAAQGVPSVVLSNIGIDIRPMLDRLGIAPLIKGAVLSCEVGVVKPDPKIFQHALELLDVPAANTLMIGDHWHDDAGAAALGIRTLLLPPTPAPATAHGLGAVLRLI